MKTTNQNVVISKIISIEDIELLDAVEDDDLLFDAVDDNDGHVWF
jgi:hypothetical protein